MSEVRLIASPAYSAELQEAVAASVRAAAEAARAWYGRGDKLAADAASVQAMRAVLAEAPFDGIVVIGEGEKDEAPMLANGERLGRAAHPSCDVAVDPLDGTRLTAEGLPGSVSVIALAPRGTLFDPRDAFYMDKLVCSSAGRGAVSLDLSPAENARRLAAALGIPVAELVVAVLDKPRHSGLIASLREAGVALELRGEGDVSVAIEAADASGRVDLVLGIGGTPEGVVAACAVRALGGVMEGRLAPQTARERERAIAAGHDLDRLLTLDALVASDDVLFAGCPV
ncbi:MULTISPECIES: fructose-bisphosphatase class II family protein [unclassified Rathayibacter]|uniref:fructose-bisphosphatase class II family protein n=1 Tax=unclassified Rathayibacter TaxID=2609250 RepID=UPI001889DC4A|nr:MULTISPECIES: fructose-bisphosphatase class II family protein [unclassified Rathayibacter]MBF4463002.1 fructose-bisphosphatase class II family protein [Rathayibacter sp. VKM Ac-2879]MBF4504416.1 fructose-bisphosphatase class II family protein [Rathayibacter sp. VKM Ac-2878]